MVFMKRINGKQSNADDEDDVHHYYDDFLLSQCFFSDECSVEMCVKWSFLTSSFRRVLLLEVEEMCCMIL